MIKGVEVKLFLKYLEDFGEFLIFFGFKMEFLQNGGGLSVINRNYVGQSVINQRVSMARFTYKYRVWLGVFHKLKWVVD